MRGSKGVCDWLREEKKCKDKRKGRYSLPTSVAFCNKGHFNAMLFPSSEEDLLPLSHWLDDTLWWHRNKEKKKGGN